ncbi:MAG: enolase C-terminal domain-like protein [Candidatus Bathyarchaeia archaeon]
MKITKVQVNIVEPEERYMGMDRMRNCPNGVPGPLGRFGLARIFTDEGIEGCYQISPGDAQTFVNFVKSYLMGSDPLDKDRLLGRFRPVIRRGAERFLFYGWPMRIVGAAECCLWDIIGKALGKPVYKLLGQCRDKLMAYASSKHIPTLEENIAHFKDCVSEGFRAFKLHPPSTNWTDPEMRRKISWKLDIKVLRAIKELAGDDITLMHDPVNTYDREVALIVGRELERLDFYVYEDPMPTSDVEGNAKLCEDLEIPIMLGEQLDDLYKYAELVRNRATDILRCILERIGGITSAMKLAHLAELHAMKMEPHSFGSQATQFAHLHVMLAMENSDFFEAPVPQGTFDTDVIKDTIRIDREGFVHAPTKPGLSFEIDEAKLKKRTVEIIT